MSCVSMAASAINWSLHFEGSIDNWHLMKTALLIEYSYLLKIKYNYISYLFHSHAMSGLKEIRLIHFVNIQGGHLITNIGQM